MRKIDNEGKSCDVSIILPIFNEITSIKETMSSLMSQDYQDGYIEIIVADGLSTDGTREYLDGLVKHNENIRILDNEKRIVSTGLNKAIRSSTGEIIIRVDGHTTLAHDYVTNCVRRLLNTSADNVGGRMDAVGRTNFGAGVAVATSTPFGVGGGRFHFATEEEWVDTVYLGAWRKELFYKIGLFDEELVRNQDDEFNYRLRSVGGKILLSPLIKSKYIVRSNPYSLTKQYFQYGFWKIRVLQKHPRQMQRRQFIPFLFVSGLFASLFLLLTSFLIPNYPIISSFFKLSSGVIPGVYACVNILYSLWISYKQKLTVFPYLLFIYPILHISYGVGFIFGLVIFINRWGDKMGDVPKLKRK